MLVLAQHLVPNLSEFWNQSRLVFMEVGWMWTPSFHSLSPIVVKSWIQQQSALRDLKRARIDVNVTVTCALLLTSYLFISAISSSIWPSLGALSAEASPCSALDTAKESRELMEGRRESAGLRAPKAAVCEFIAPARRSWRSVGQ